MNKADTKFLDHEYGISHWEFVINYCIIIICIFWYNMEEGIILARIGEMRPK